MERYPKRIKRQIRELVGQAYENELERELGKLGQHFDEWREGKISAGELTELVRDTPPTEVEGFCRLTVRRSASRRQQLAPCPGDYAVAVPFVPGPCTCPALSPLSLGLRNAT
jgi:hypothetical protein